MRTEAQIFFFRHKKESSNGNNECEFLSLNVCRPIKNLFFSLQSFLFLLFFYFLLFYFFSVLLSQVFILLCCILRRPVFLSNLASPLDSNRSFLSSKLLSLPRRMTIAFFPPFVFNPYGSLFPLMLLSRILFPFSCHSLGFTPVNQSLFCPSAYLHFYILFFCPCNYPIYSSFLTIPSLIIRPVG